jgi:hypothetical protein
MDQLFSSRVFQQDPIPFRSLQVQAVQLKYLQERDNAVLKGKKYNIIYNTLYILLNVLVLISTVLAFLFTSRIFSDTTNLWIGLTVGIIGVVVTTIHNILNGNGYQTKKVLYKMVSNHYNKMINNLNTNFDSLEKSEIEHNFIQNLI